ncbi:MAG: hypothetical protein KGP28_00555 [Bdellovibrionales bacterium]|nr:hypothetical protein [Bdellovibrionales bacterium]
MIFPSKFKLKWSESLLISLFSVMSMFAFDRFWQKPHSLELMSLKARISETRKKVEDTQKVLEGLKNRVPAVADNQTTLSLLDRYLSSNDRFSNVIQGIFKGSKESEFSIQSIVALQSNRFEGYTQTLYSLEAESSFIAIGKFLENLEDSSLLTEIESIDIARIENELKQCKASIRLYGYVGGASR